MDPFVDRELTEGTIGQFPTEGPLVDQTPTMEPILEQSTIKLTTADPFRNQTVGLLMDQPSTLGPLIDQPSTLGPLMDQPSTLGPLMDQAPCFPLRPGDVDFQTVDLIAVYKLDWPDAPGVKMVQGSQSLQRAYRIGKGANLTLPVQ